MPHESNPAPPTVAPGPEYDRLARETGHLHVQQCRACSRTIHPPRVLCHSCGSQDLQWRPCAGHGVVHSVTEVVSRGEDPYAVALVDLAEGFRMMASVPTGTPIEAPVTLVSLGEGDQVVARFARTQEVRA